MCFVQRRYVYLKCVVCSRKAFYEQVSIRSECTKILKIAESYRKAFENLRDNDNFDSEFRDDVKAVNKFEREAEKCRKKGETQLPLETTHQVHICTHCVKNIGEGVLEYIKSFMSPPEPVASTYQANSASLSGTDHIGTAESSECSSQDDDDNVVSETSVQAPPSYEESTEDQSVISYEQQEHGHVEERIRRRGSNGRSTDTNDQESVKESMAPSITVTSASPSVKSLPYRVERRHGPRQREPRPQNLSPEYKPPSKRRSRAPRRDDPEHQPPPLQRQNRITRKSRHKARDPHAHGRGDRTRRSKHHGRRAHYVESD